MSVYETNRPATVGTFSGVFGLMVSTFTAWNDARATRKALTKLSDRELDDIGLCRSDIDSITKNI
ncbi:MAG: DUF1127 domain-containing protein [Rhodobacteraceae bacterium]|nr:DUF1127 domain-containing protein [Paracoccaceae bacterium]MCP5342577.1 DUF1127 domain-containing protein [Paracoccaceae bacterium]